MNKKILFKSIFCLLLAVSICVLTACGGGGHSHNDSGSSRASVRVTVPSALLNASLRANQVSAIRSDLDVTKLILQTKAYLNGAEVNGVSIENLVATLSGSNYIFDVKNLLTTYEYRFIALYNDKVILQNQIAQNQVIEGNNIPVDVNTSYKVLAFDAWIAKNPDVKAIDNFVAACKEAGIDENTENAFSVLTTVSISSYTDLVKQIIGGEEVTLPTKDDMNVEEISTEDKTDPEPTPAMTAAQHADVFRASIFSIFAMEQCIEALSATSDVNEISNMPPAFKALAKGSEMDKYVPNTVDKFMADSGIRNAETGDLTDSDWGTFGRGARGILVSNSALAAIAELDAQKVNASKLTAKLIGQNIYIVGLSFFTINGQDYTLALVLQRSYREGAQHPNDYHLGYAKIWQGTRNDVDFDTNEGYVGKIEKNLNAWGPEASETQAFDASKIVYTSNNGESYTHWYSVMEGVEGGDGSVLFPTTK